MAGYKAGMKISGESGLSFNACVFATEEEANGAGKELMSRWFVPIGFEVVAVDDAPNYVFENGKPARI